MQTACIFFSLVFLAGILNPPYYSDRSLRYLSSPSHDYDETRDRGSARIWFFDNTQFIRLFSSILI